MKAEEPNGTEVNVQKTEEKEFYEKESKDTEAAKDVKKEAVKEQNEFQKYNSSLAIETLPTCSRAQLSRFDGVSRPELYVAIRGLIYDVTGNPDKYGQGKSYNRLVGKDVSRLLGLNILKLPQEEEDEKPDWEKTWDTSGLTPEQQQIVDKWALFFQARYKIVGVVLDHVQSK